MIITVFVYIFISFTLLISFYLYKYIKKDLKQQELNQIQKEINILQNKLLNLTDIKQQEHIKHKIELLKQEFQQNLYD
ncbi:MAG: hypothetical protein U9R37_04635 [Campylobacterota bacterium]|nr:hypothetical protein [Campylobacterota bacterium]